jgi:hypothetical protein
MDIHVLPTNEKGIIEVKSWNETPIKENPFFLLNFNGTSA